MIFVTRKKFQKAYKKSHMTIKKEISVMTNINYERKNLLKLAKEHGKNNFFNPFNTLGLLAPIYFINKKIKNTKIPLLLLINKIDTDQKSGLIEAIQTETTRLSSLATSFLDIARLESGRTQFQLQKYNYNQ